MSSKFHINKATGEPGFCTASVRACPHGGAEEHYSSEAEARSAFEASQSSFKKSSYRRIKHDLPLPQKAKLLMERLSATGAQPYVVGGAVRDSLISGLAPKDIDIEVYNVASIEKLQSTLRSSGYNVDAVGKAFGVLKVNLGDGLDIDLSLPRRDNLVGKGHRGFDVTTDPALSLKDAAGRRDFTINALYYDSQTGEIIDPHGGLEDWSTKELRHINQHFSEDPLRVLRGMQFAGRFSMKLSPETAAEARSIVSEFSTLPTDRTTEEFEKLYQKSEDIRFGLTALKASGWDQPLGLDGLSLERSGDALQGLLSRARAKGLDTGVIGAAGLLRHGAPSDPESTVKSILKSANRQRDAVNLSRAEAPEELTEVSVRAWARRLQKEHLTIEHYRALHGEGDRSAKTLYRLAEEAGVMSSADPDLVLGRNAIRLSGRKGGRWLSEILREAGEAQDSGAIRSSADAELWLKARLESLYE